MSSFKLAKETAELTKETDSRARREIERTEQREDRLKQEFLISMLDGDVLHTVCEVPMSIRPISFASPGEINDNDRCLVKETPNLNYVKDLGNLCCNERCDDCVIHISCRMDAGA